MLSQASSALTYGNISKGEAEYRPPRSLNKRTTAAVTANYTVGVAASFYPAEDIGGEAWLVRAGGRTRQLARIKDFGRSWRISEPHLGKLKLSTSFICSILRGFFDLNLLHFFNIGENGIHQRFHYELALFFCSEARVTPSAHR